MFYSTVFCFSMICLWTSLSHCSSSVIKSILSFLFLIVMNDNWSNNIITTWKIKLKQSQFKNGKSFLRKQIKYFYRTFNIQTIKNLFSYSFFIPATLRICKSAFDIKLYLILNFEYNKSWFLTVINLKKFKHKTFKLN